jgi:protein TonB
MAMDMTFESRPSRSVVGVGLVLLLHAILGWLIVSGMGQRMVEAVRQPLEVALLDRPPPRPEPPPPTLAQPPPLAPPPPSYVPPPEIRIQRPPPPAPRITVQRRAPRPAPVVIAPAPAPAPPSPAPPAPQPAPAPPPPAPPAPPAAPPAPPPDLSRPARVDVAACERPAYPRLARSDGATGVTRVRFEIDAGGVVVGATVVQRSGRSRAHQLLDRAAVDALSGCRFEAGRDASGQATGGQATVAYVWSLD